MSTNGVSADTKPISLPTRGRSFFFSGLALRLLIAFVISWIIVLAFFASGAISH